jgi:preprotein translocase subunit SecD
MYDELKENWRIVLLTIFIVTSGVAMFVPLGGNSSGGAVGELQLEYDIALDGGTRIRAPLVGMTAEDVDVGRNATSSVQSTVADELGVDAIDVVVRRQQSQSAVGTPQQRQQARGYTVEVFDRDVTEDEFASALQAAGYDVTAEQIRPGVTDQTRERTITVIQNKIDESGLSGGTVQQSRGTGERQFIVIEAPNRDADELRDILENRGVVRVVAYYPNENGTYVNETALEQGDFSRIGASQQAQNGDYFVPVTVSDAQAETFANRMVETGYGSGTACQFQRYGEASGRCLLTVLDGEVVYSAGVEPGLGQSFRNGDFTNDPAFRMTTRNQSEAQDLSLSLRAGRLPTTLAFDRGTTFQLEPALADRFKVNSFLTGLIAVIAVSLVVFLRYGDPRVAVPMIVTALSEVLILLGFAAGFGFPLDLSHIAGFIAVIGTGIDDLIIIANEVMAEGDVNSRRIFQNRFKRAFWVIGAAAATTILAMAPLAIGPFAVGDLQGFAIITIAGVLVGVLVTRPAYGDILRRLLIDDRT